MDPAIALTEQAEKILASQKALNLATTQSKVMSSNALRYATFLTGALLNMQTQLISKEVLRKAFMEVNLQDLQITEDQAAKQTRKRFPSSNFCSDRNTCDRSTPNQDQRAADRIKY